MKKLLSALLITALLFSTVCGCNDKGKEKTDSKPETSSTEIQSTLSSDEVISSEEIVSSDIVSSEDIFDDTVISTITPLDTPSEEDASSGETSTSSAESSEAESEVPSVPSQAVESQVTSATPSEVTPSQTTSETSSAVSSEATTSSDATSSDVTSEPESGSPSDEENKTEEEGEKPIGHRIKGGINFEALQGGKSGTKGYKEYVYDRKYWELVAEAGFDNVRLPVQLHDYIIGDAPSWDLDMEAMRWLDVAINHGLDCGLVVILDFHHSCYKEEPEKFKRVWQQTAERYRDYPEELFFEIVNEPNGVSHNYLNILQIETYNIIRETNPTRTIAFATNWFNSSAALDKTVIPGPETDPNIIVSIHNYAPMDYSHAGMGGKYGAAKADFDPAWEQTITNAVAKLADYEKQQGIPIWVSEWGAYQGGSNWNKEDMSQYYSWWSKAFAKYDIAYAVWEFNHGFGVFNWDKQEWVDYLFDSLIIQW